MKCMICIGDDNCCVVSGRRESSARYLAGAVDLHGPQLTTLVLKIGIRGTVIGLWLVS